MSEPVSNAESAELGEIAVVENQDEMTRCVAETGQRVRKTARKIPDIAGIEVVDLRTAKRVERRGAHTPFHDKGPFGRGRVPVQLTRHARLKPH